MKPARSSVALLSSTRIWRTSTSAEPAAADPFRYRLSVLAQLAHEFLSRKTSVALFGSVSCIVFLSAAVPDDPIAMLTVLVSAASAPALTQIAPNAPAAAV